MNTCELIKNLCIESFNTFATGRYKEIEIGWSSDAGFGIYSIYRDLLDDKIYADSEMMDCDEDKEFLSALLQELVKKIEVVG